MNLGPSVKAPLFVEGPAAYADFLPYARLLGRLSDAAVVEKLPDADAPVAIAGEARLMLKVEIDKAAETARLTKEIGKAESDVEKLTAKLEKPGYVDKAPAQLVERDRAQLADLTDKLAKLKAQLLKLA